MNAYQLPNTSHATVNGGLDGRLEIIERRAKDSARISLTTGLVAAGGLACALYFTLFAPGAVPGIEALTLPADVVGALQLLNRAGAEPTLGIHALGDPFMTVFQGMLPLLKLMGGMMLVLGMFAAVVKKSLGPLLMAAPLLGASFVLPSMFPELASSEIPPKEITIECVSERRCFSTLNEAAPVGTAGRHFINAQLYAFGQRPEAVARELHALRQLNEAAKIQSDHKEVITALLIAAGEPLEGEHAQIAADAAEKHQRYQEGGKSFLAVAGIMGGIAVLFGAFALFLRLRVRSIRSLLSLTGGQRRLVTKEVGEQIPGS